MSLNATDSRVIIKLLGPEEIAFHKHPKLLWVSFKVFNTVRILVNLNQSANCITNEKGKCIIVRYWNTSVKRTRLEKWEGMHNIHILFSYYLMHQPMKENAC